MIWVPNQLVGAPAGTDVTIDCHTEAHPRAIIYWVYNSVMVLPSKKYIIDYEENSYRAYMKLTIKNLQVADFGNYRCISKNSLGETEGSIRVYGGYIKSRESDRKLLRREILIANYSRPSAEIPQPSQPSNKQPVNSVESRESK